VSHAAPWGEGNAQHGHAGAIHGSAWWHGAHTSALPQGAVHSAHDCGRTAATERAIRCALSNNAA
jgi:hypothetical protein